MQKTVKVKYRGVLGDTGKFVFGDALTCDGNYILQLAKIKPQYGYIVSYHIKPNSAALLVGYDCNGAEIYEGDTLVDDTGKKITADTRMCFFYDCMLKKETDDNEN